jgi:hypothetical protein
LKKSPWIRRFTHEETESHGLEAHATFRDDHFTQGASDGVVIRFGDPAADG